jgi:hypothetical protein
LPSPILQVDEILESALKAKIDFDENDLSENVEDQLTHLAASIRMARDLGWKTYRNADEIPAVKNAVARIVERFERGEVRLVQDILKIGTQIEKVRGEPDDFIFDVCQECEEKIAALMKVGKILGIKTDVDAPDWKRELNAHAYKSVAKSVSKLKDLVQQVDGSVKTLLKKKGWRASVIVLFDKLQGGARISDLSDQEWEDLDKLRNDELGSRITVALGYQ